MPIRASAMASRRCPTRPRDVRLHAPRGAGGAACAAAGARHRAADPHRPQRRRVNRPDPCRNVKRRALRRRARPAGVAVLAPHLFVEAGDGAEIAKVRAAFEASGLGRRLARYHRDPAATFHSWADVWLSDAFLQWNIEAEVAAIACPLLAIQGEDDQYGTALQIERLVQLEPAGEGADAARLPAQPASGATRRRARRPDRIRCRTCRRMSCPSEQARADGGKSR